MNGLHFNSRHCHAKTPSRKVNPFRNIRVDDKKFDAVYFSDMAPIFGVAVGLATRKVEK